jgi:hypothetical protein
MEAPLTHQFMLATAVETSAALTSSSFTAGETGLFKVSNLANVTGTVSDANIDGSRVFFAQRLASTYTNEKTRKSLPFNAKNVDRIVIRTTATASPEIWHVGFNGSNTETLGFNCETEYGIKVVFNSPFISKYYGNAGYTYTANIMTECCEPCDAGCGEGTFAYVEAAKLVAAFQISSAYEPFNVNTQFVWSPANFAIIELVMDGEASDTVADFTNASTMQFTYGSPIVTTSAANTLAPGDFIRISDNGANTVNTDPVYRIKSVESSTSFTLDVPWLRPDLTANLTTTLSTSDVSVVTVSGTTLVGIKFTSRFISQDTGCCCFPPFPYDVDGVTMIITDSLVNSFPCGFVATKAQSINYGQGAGYQLQYDEMEALGFSDKREWFRQCEYNYDYKPQVVTTTNYDVAHIYYRVPLTDGMSGYHANRICLTIAATNASLILQSGGPGALYSLLLSLANYADCPIIYNGTEVGLT